MRRPIQSKFSSSVAPTGKLPAKFDVSELKNLRPFMPRGAPQVMTAEELATAAGKALLEGVQKKDPALILAALAMTTKVSYTFLGGSDYLSDVAEPMYAEWVKPAAETYLDNDGAVQEVAPAVAEAVDSTALQASVDQLNLVEQAEQILTPTVTGLGRVRKHLRNDIYGALVIVDRLARQGILNSLTLSRNMEPFNRVFTEGSTEALASRKNNEKVADDSRDDTIEDVKEALARAKKTPPQGDPPIVAPAVDLDALKSNRNRSRGRNRSDS